MDRLFGLNPFEAERPDHESGDEVGQDQRLAPNKSRDAEQPRHDDGQGKVVDQLVHRVSLDSFDRLITVADDAETHIRARRARFALSLALIACPWQARLRPRT